MKTKRIDIGKHKIFEVISNEILIRNIQDVLNLMAQLSSDHIVLHDSNFEQDFFDLSTGKLGEILQKFTNYHVKLAIIGNFETYPSKTLKDFIYETNLHKDHLFVSSLEEVKKIWSG